MKQLINLFLSASRLERIGIAVLACICCLAFFYPALYRAWAPTHTQDFSEIAAVYQNAFALEGSGSKTTQNPNAAALFEFDPNTASLEDFEQLGLSTRTAQSILNYRSKGGKFKRPEDFKKIYALAEKDYLRLLPLIRIGTAPAKYVEAAEQAEIEPQLSLFDPNSVEATQLEAMGLPKGTVRTWLNYRSKGGKFRYREDVERLYALDAEDYRRLAPYINLPSRSAAAEAPRPVAYASGYTAPAPAKPRAQKIDINTATVEDWDQLPGIGKSWAQRILQYRDKLGGFTNPAQVAETRGLPDSIFQKAQAFLSVGSAVYRPITVNTATKEELAKHPYIDFKIAQMIVLYRSRYGSFQNANDLIKVPEVKMAWLDKVRPYLVF